MGQHMEQAWSVITLGYSTTVTRPHSANNIVTMTPVASENDPIVTLLQES